MPRSNQLHPYSAYPSVPTVFAAEDFDATADATALEAAMKGSGSCDEDMIINILAYRTLSQRQQIAAAFLELTSNDLVEELKAELHRHFEDIVVAMMTPLPELYARELHRAVHGPGTDEKALVEVLMALSNFGVIDVATEYENQYGKSLENDLKSDTSGEFRNLLVKLCSATRDESDIVVEENARDDAIALAEAGASQWASEESVFSTILASRSFPHLVLMFRIYRSITGRDIEAVIEHEFSGDLRKGFLSIVRIVRKRRQFFARRLHEAMKGLGTDDRTLIRVLVTRSEIDLGDIKQEFLALYGKTLEEWIEKDTTGHYKKMCLALVTYML